MQPNPVEAYIAQYEGPHADIMRTLRALVKRTLPHATEKISWGMPSYALKGNVFHYAAHKNHVGVYPGADAMTAFHDEIAPRYHMSKGAFQLPLGEPVPEDLIVRILTFNAKAEG